jgi:choline dehydrogenase-like flavoprotein
MDHPSATVGRFRAEDCRWINDRFGFYGLAHQRRVYMYMHGLVLSPAIQKREQLLNCAAYMMEERASDDPWDALKRILRAKTNAPIADLVAVASSPGLLARGAGARLLQSNIAPKFVKDHLIAGMIRHFPNSVAREYRDRGLPHKLTGITIDTITEQVPDPESRIFLSDQTDALGVPIAKANWRVDQQARQSLVRLGQVLEAEFTRVGLPTPILEPWVTNSRPEDSVIIDMAHTSGTTRMSDDPKAGVVNSDCQIHGVANLYIAGASVFPTSGHANPMLMILALAIRLADHIKTYI